MYIRIVESQKKNLSYINDDRKKNGWKTFFFWQLKGRKTVLSFHDISFLSWVRVLVRSGQMGENVKRVGCL